MLAEQIAGRQVQNNLVLAPQIDLPGSQSGSVRDFRRPRIRWRRPRRRRDRSHQRDEPLVDCRGQFRR